MTTSLVC
ncbi:GGDEF family domain protein, partial [Vibrio parahaemolyticus V-223/04]